MFFKIEFENGYCGCTDTHYEQFDTVEDAEAWAKEGLHDYGESYEHCAAGCDFNDGWESEEAEETYYENLSYNITEMDEDEWHDESGE